MFVLLTSFVSADLRDSLEFYMSFENECVDKTGNNTLVCVNPSYNNGFLGDYGMQNVTTITDSSPSFGVWNDTDSFSVSAWFNFTNLSNQEVFFYDAHGGPLFFYIIQLSVGSNLVFYQAENNVCGDGDAIYSMSGKNIGQWYHVVWVYNATNNLRQIYLDNVLVASDVYSCVGADIDASDPIWRSQNEIFHFDETALYLRALTTTDIGELYNSGNGFMPIVNEAPTVNLVSPFDDDHVRQTNFSYVYSDADSDLGNCSLVINDTLSGDNLSVPSGTTIVRSANISLSDGVYDWYVNCSDGNYMTKSVVRTVVIDSVNPIITWNNPLFDNTSQFFSSLESGFNLDIDLFDIYLFAWNFTIENSVGVVVQSNADNNLNLTSFTITDFVNLSSLPYDDYIINVTVSDDHTAKEILVYDHVISSKMITYDTGSSIISIENLQGNIKSILTDKLLDRYTFSFEPNNNRKTWNFQLSCDKELFYRGELYDYPSFVCGDNWVDLNVVSASVESYFVSKVDDNNYVVTIEMVKDNNNHLLFNSLGGLNIVTETKQFSSVDDTCDVNLSTTPCKVGYDLTLNNGVYQINGTITFINPNILFDGSLSSINGSGLAVVVNAENVTITDLEFKDGFSSALLVNDTGFSSYGNTYRSIVYDNVVGSKFCDYDTLTGNYFIGGFYSGVNIGTCPSSNEFSLGTTNFSVVSDWTNVDLVLENAFGVIDFSLLLNLSSTNADFDSDVEIVQDSIGVDAVFYPNLDSDASLTFKNVVAHSIADITLLKDGSLCTVGCSGATYNEVSDEYSVLVTGFSTYTLSYKVVYESEDLSPMLIDFLLNILKGLIIISPIVAIIIIVKWFKRRRGKK